MRQFEISGEVARQDMENVKEAWKQLEVIDWSSVLNQETIYYPRGTLGQLRFMVTIKFQCRDCDVGPNLMSLAAAGMLGERPVFPLYGDS
jgi:hypothetical protein